MASTLTKTIPYIYKIVPSSTTLPLTQNSKLPLDFTLPASALDTSSQFIHMSTPAQIPITLNKFFPTTTSSRDTVYLLRVELGPLEEKEGVVRWETPDGGKEGERGGEGVFPHLYFEGGRLGLSGREVESVDEVVSEVGKEGWEEGVERVRGSGWLV
jgi:uncharacterized protein (DUF952 family)